jgi:hypothetical protein
MAEYITDPVSLELMRRRDKSVAEIDVFEDLHLSASRSVREAITSGERTFGEFLRVLKAEPSRAGCVAISPAAERRAPQFQADVRHRHVRWPSIRVKHCLMLARFAGCGDRSDAVLAHVGERHVAQQDARFSGARGLRWRTTLGNALSPALPLASAPSIAAS